ncbi:MAG: hypothetical protein ACOX6Y_01305 [Christensenellales bacterium]|jgi:hypothetical protein
MLRILLSDLYKKNAGHSQMPHHNSKRQTEVFISYFLLLSVLVFHLIRAKYGFDWSDEGYYTASAVDILTKKMSLTGNYSIHQTSSLLLLPFVSLYRLFTGSNDGIMVFMRYMYCVIAFSVSVGVYRVLVKKGYSSISSVVISLLILLTCPSNVMTLSYNTLSFLLMTAAFFAVKTIFFGKLKYFISGLFFAAAVQAYPYLVISMPIFILYLIYEAEKEIGVSLSKFSYFLIGIIFVFLVFIVQIIINTPLTNLFDNLRSMWLDPGHLNHNYIEKTYKIIRSITLFFGRKQLIVLISLYLFAIAIYIMRRNGKYIPSVIETSGLLFVMLLFLLRLGIILRLREEPTTVTNYYALSLSFACGYLCILFSIWNEAIWLGLLGGVFSIAVNAASNNGIALAAYPCIFSVMGSVMVLEAIWRRTNSKMVSLTSRFVLIITASLLLFNMGYNRATAVYRDENINVLTAKIERGPAKGIITTYRSANEYNAVLNDFDTIDKMGNGPVFISRLLPFGYMYFDRPAGAPTLWTTPMNSLRLSDFYLKYPQLVPDTVIILQDFVGVMSLNDNNPPGGYFSNKQFEDEYHSIPLKTMVVYEKRAERKENEIRR